jgi:hypothetical protein
VSLRLSSNFTLSHRTAEARKYIWTVHTHMHPHFHWSCLQTHTYIHTYIGAFKYGTPHSTSWKLYICMYVHQASVEYTLTRNIWNLRLQTSDNRYFTHVYSTQLKTVHVAL